VTLSCRAADYPFLPKIKGFERIPCGGMVVDKSPGSFDFALLGAEGFALIAALRSR
jgi:hypothetical protein